MLFASLLLVVVGQVSGQVSGAEQVEADELSSLSSLSLEELLSMKLETGSFLELDLSRAPLAMTIIKREQIFGSGARTMSELLEIFVPGFAYMPSRHLIGGFQGYIWGMRGIVPTTNSGVLYLVNGIKLNTEGRYSNDAETALGLFGDIERVEVLRGPAGLVYGSGALAGVVNVVTREPTSNTANARLMTGRWHEALVDVFSNVALGDEVNLRLAGGMTYARGSGNRKSRIYVITEEPSPPPLLEGAPADGSAWADPGSFRLSADLDYQRFNLYARVTQQKIPVGPYVVVDPWPEIEGQVPPGSPTRVIDGETIDHTHPLADDNVNSNGASRNVQETTTVTVNGKYKYPVGEDTLVGELGLAMVQERSYYQFRKGYRTALHGASQGLFGERRYLGRLVYLLRSVERVQAAAGLEARYDDIGESFQGLNFNGTAGQEPYLSEVGYLSLAAFVEAAWQMPWAPVTLHGGARIDKHTRTPFLVNPKLAAVWEASPDHSVRLVYHTSSNNGRAFDYEPNYFSLNVDGTVTANFFDVDLQPERVQAVELGSIDVFFEHLTLQPSVSVAHVSNLFSWSEALQRIVNAGEYNIFDAEIDVQLDWGPVRASASHAFQVPIFTETDFETLVFNGVPYNVKSITDQVTQDGESFINLPTNMSKLYLEYTPIDMLTLTTSTRVFWSLSGRALDYEQMRLFGWGDLGVTKSPIIKLDVGAIVKLPYDFALSAFGYNLLGGAKSRNSVRWSHHTYAQQRALYTVDLPTFRVALDKTF